MADSIERLGKIKRNDYNERIGLEQSVTVCRRLVVAAVVDAVGRKANWSENSRPVGGFWIAGYR